MKKILRFLKATVYVLGMIFGVVLVCGIAFIPVYLLTLVFDKYPILYIGILAGFVLVFPVWFLVVLYKFAYERINESELRKNNKSTW